MSLQYGELRPTSGWDRFVSLGHPNKFPRVSRLGSVTARHLIVGVSQTAALTEGATYIRQGGHHVGHWPTFLVCCMLTSAYQLPIDVRNIRSRHCSLPWPTPRIKIACTKGLTDSLTQAALDASTRHIVDRWIAYRTPIRELSTPVRVIQCSVTRNLVNEWMFSSLYTPRVMAASRPLSVLHVPKCVWLYDYITTYDRMR